MIAAPARPLRILLSIHHRLERSSGAAGVVMRIAEEYRHLGHDATVASHEDVPTIVPKLLRGLLFPFVLAAMIRRRQPDVVDASSGDGWFAYSRDAGRARLHVTHSHGLEHLSSERECAGGRFLPFHKRIWRHGLRLRLVARSFALADLSLVLNDAEADHLSKALSIEPSTIHRIRLGTDHAGILVDDGPRHPAAIVQIGAYTQRKGVTVVAAAMVPILEETPGSSMMFVGTGVPRQIVLDDYPDHLHDRIIVVEHYSNDMLPGLLADRCICLMPSLFEGYGIAKLEAMACGLAVVVSDDAGAKADVIDGCNGLIVACGDAEALRQAVRTLVAQPQYVRRLRAAGFETSKMLSWDKIARDRVSLYATHFTLKEARNRQHIG
ncbi:glycosyltransferase family 4 protein [Sphingomonas sp. M6A6_1c]